MFIAAGVAGCGLLGLNTGLGITEFGDDSFHADVYSRGEIAEFYAWYGGLHHHNIPRFVLLTHHRRDTSSVPEVLNSVSAQVVAPAAERALFEDVDRYWRGYENARFHDYAQQSSKVYPRAVEVDRWVRGGDKFTVGDIEIDVMDTPGYTRGAISYLFEVDGQRVAATGELIYGDGQIHDLFSLQDAIPEADTRGYHGYASRAKDVIESLRKIAAWDPDIIIPARGPVIENPQESIGKLIERLQRLFKLYYRTDALRWYWGDDNLRTRAARVLSDATVDWMPMANEMREIPPRWMHKFGTSRVLVSDTRKAFLLDCGSDEIMRDILDLKARGGFDKIEGIFVTHFHDDHTDRVQAMAEECDCPVYSGPEVKDILERPGAYRMPAMTDQAIEDVQALKQGDSFRWHEFTFTYEYFPGQALYHGGLKVERQDGEKFFFVGDSFSPSGLDDYCLQNRHFLHADLGHFLCLKKIRESDPSFWLVNQHIEPVFRYSPEQIDFMLETLEGKRKVIAELVPWPDPNFGVDEHWARLYPYGNEVQAGDELTLYAVIFNHNSETTEFEITPHFPDGWAGPTQALSVSVEPLTEGRVEIPVRIPEGATGLTIVTADVGFGDRFLYQWVEAMVSVR